MRLAIRRVYAVSPASKTRRVQIDRCLIRTGAAFRRGISLRGGHDHSAARPNGLPSESRQIAHRSAWVDDAPFELGDALGRGGCQNSDSAPEQSLDTFRHSTRTSARNTALWQSVEATCQMLAHDMPPASYPGRAGGGQAGIHTMSPEAE